MVVAIIQTSAPHIIEQNHLLEQIIQIHRPHEYAVSISWDRSCYLLEFHGNILKKIVIQIITKKIRQSTMGRWRDEILPKLKPSRPPRIAPGASAPGESIARRCPGSARGGGGSGHRMEHINQLLFDVLFALNYDNCFLFAHSRGS